MSPQQSISYNCPTCGQLFKSPESWIGNKVVCARCGQKVTVPSPPSVVLQPSDKTLMGDLVSPVAKRQPPRPRRHDDEDDEDDEDDDGKDSFLKRHPIVFSAIIAVPILFVLAMFGTFLFVNFHAEQERLQKDQEMMRRLGDDLDRIERDAADLRFRR